MNKKAYTSIIGTFFFLVFNFLGTSNLFAQEATFDLRFLTEVDCNQDGLTATLQMKVRNDSFRIGTSSILFNYDETVIAFKDYESITFDENNTVSIFGSEQPVWSPHRFNSTVPGICNLTLLIDIAAASLPAVKTDWIDIGSVNFDVINLNASPNLTFDIPNTNFNRYDPNDGSQAPTKGDFSSYDELLATQCACAAPIVTNDTLTFDCFESSFTANLISNDAISNATFSITSNPTKGTASINPNGQLTYTSNDFFCGSDQLTYQVCNDGDTQCCAEANVFINFSDDVKPFFTNPPLDITVSCGELPVLETILASDACSEIQILQEESILDGDCANSRIHVRTWTAFDGCGNSEVYIQNITVIDDVPPVINCLDDFIVLCGTDTNGIDSGTPLYSDNCSDSTQITLSFTDGVLEEFSQDKVVGQFIRTWTATDECGNSSNCTQLIQIVDDVAPILFCPSDITINCGDDISTANLSSVEAFDSCSVVSLSFVDVGVIPAECNFDTVTILRTWTAEDACGNKTECVQNIIVQGTPCASTITREVTNYLCEGSTVNLKSIMGFGENTSVSIFEGNEEPIIDPTTFTLPLTGCSTGTFEFVFQTFNEAQCLTENSRLIIKTIPNLIMTPFVAADECSAELVFECPDLYEVTWSSGSNSGTGTTYFATPGQSGVVLFNIKYVGDNLPDSLDLTCLTDIYEVQLNCKPDCPTGIEETIQITGCEGDFINLVNELQLNDSDSIVTSIITVDNFQEFELIANPTDSCGVVYKEFIVTIYNENGCLIRNVVVGLEIIKKVIATISHEDDFCKVRLNLDCPELYTIRWEDNNNVVGFGTEYEGAEGTSGFVTFHVSLIDTTIVANSCGNNTFVADYSCPSNCPESTERNESFAVCAETTINIFERLNLSDDKTYVTENTDIIDGVYQIGNFFGCETGIKNQIILGYDDNQCLIETINVEITVLPAIYGDILSPMDPTCVVTLGLECPENYSISWEDNIGNSGNGTTYVPAENTSGTVTFTANYVPESIILSAVELGCMQKTFEADFNCTTACPETIERAETLLACGRTSIDIFERLNLTDDKTYLFEDEQVIDGVYQVDESFGCVIGMKNFQISGYDANQCLIEIINLSITIFPPFFTNEARTSDDGCKVSLSLECSELYTVTWEDDKGRTGDGINYTAEENTSGTVRFFVDFASDDIIISETELECFSAIAEGTYNCTSNCPDTINRDEAFTACAETTINLFDILDLGDAYNYTFENEAIIDGVYQIENFFGCEVGTKNIEIKGYDSNECLVEIINVEITVFPAIYADILTTADALCGINLSLECVDNYIVRWEDTNGNFGEGTNYTAPENTEGSVKFTVEYLTDAIIFSEFELNCFSQVFEADYNCILDCPEPISEAILLTGCHGDIINLKERLDFSDNITYTILNNTDNLNAEELVLQNNTNDCTIETLDIIVEVRDENNCLTKILSISVNVIPEIRASLVDLSEGCGVALELACPEKYTVVWTDDLGNRGEGLIYEAAAGSTGIVEFIITFNDSLLTDNESCYIKTIANDFGCCNPVGTACDDGKSETLGDQEDGDCGCFGTPCALDNKGIVFDGSEIGGCSLLIELSDGSILEPVVLPDGVTLEIGQELSFSFIELIDRVSACQSGEIVEIICLENSCPEKGTPCTDGDLATINDAHDGNCNCVGESVPTVEDEISLRFRPSLNCETNAYCVMLQAKGQQTDFSIGTSSIMVNYNANALEFVDYTSAQFDENETCIGGTSSPWGEHQYDATSVPGKMCLTMILNSEGASCPEITAEKWEDIGQICFDIMDNDALPNITFDTSKTHFNSSTPNDGTAAIKIGELHEIDTEDALACTENDVAVRNEVSIKAFLQGAFKRNKGTMDDMLRKKRYIPLTEPYTGLPSFVHFGNGGGETTTNEVLSVKGDDAIVDWVFIELRSASDAKTIIATKAGLIQRDGDIVDVDGVSNLQFMVPNESYFICVKHRNHLGAMTGEPVDFSANETILVDFSDPDMNTYGTNAQIKIEETMALWGGNANPDKHIILAGGGLGLPDRDIIFFDIFLSLWYANPNTPITYNSVLQGYYGSDTNLDGQVKYQGPTNDIDAIIFFNVLFHPENTQFRLNFSISEQIP